MCFSNALRISLTAFNVNNLFLASGKVPKSPISLSISNKSYFVYMGDYQNSHLDIRSSDSSKADNFKFRPDADCKCLSNKCYTELSVPNSIVIGWSIINCLYLYNSVHKI